MLTENLRKELIEQIKKDPKKAAKLIEKEPKILDLLLQSDGELNKTKQELNNEKIKYVNMSSHMQQQLKEKAAQLKTSQGLLIGAGVLWFLSMLDDN